MFYAVTYVLTTLGTFGMVILLSRAGHEAEEIKDLAGLAKRSPWFALVMTLFMFSLAGIPPMAGFWGKYYVFLAAVNAQLWPLAVLGVIASVISCFYYIRIVKLMYFDDPKEVRFLPAQLRTAGVYSLSAILLVLAFLPFPLRVGSTGDWLVGAARTAATSLCAGETARAGVTPLAKCQVVRR
jgi:NADH-quinone oxidoreductase subunit N